MRVSDTQNHQNTMLRPQKSDRKIMGIPLYISDKCIDLNNELLFARPVNNQAAISVFVAGEQPENCEETLNNIHQPVVLSTLSNMQVVIKGSWMVEILSISQAATLFSFLDYQAKSSSNIPEPSSLDPDNSLLIHNDQNLAILVDDEKKLLLELLISTLLTPKGSRLEHLFLFIRNRESYWISYFLLSQMMNEDKESDNHKIGKASKIYGVSESYFRKLCQNAFTRGPKKQLRLWRAAHSALQLIENDNSIATIAGDNGYSSSSHFSTEIKSMFGITPKQFKNLEGLLHE